MHPLRQTEHDSTFTYPLPPLPTPPSSTSASLTHRVIPPSVPSGALAAAPLFLPKGAWKTPPRSISHCCRRRPPVPGHAPGWKDTRCERSCLSSPLEGGLPPAKNEGKKKESGTRIRQSLNEHTDWCPTLQDEEPTKHLQIGTDVCRQILLRLYSCPPFFNPYNFSGRVPGLGISNYIFPGNSVRVTWWYRGLEHDM